MNMKNNNNTKNTDKDVYPVGHRYKRKILLSYGSLPANVYK